MTRMHSYLILEMALMLRKDIDDTARVSERAGVVAAVGLGTADPLLLRAFGLKPLYSLKPVMN